MIPAKEIIAILQIHVDKPHWSQNRIARKLTISKLTVKTVFTNNFGHKRRTFVDEKQDWVLENLHLPTKELAAHCGVTPTAIYKFLQRRGLNKRNLCNLKLD